MIYLYYNYFVHKNEDRAREIRQCFINNMQNNNFTTVLIDSQNKLKYSDYFEKINKNSSDDDINIICNSDIYFDDTISLAKHIKHKQLYALCRYEVSHDKQISFSNRPDSQDVWIFRGKIHEKIGDYTLGTPGCDNKIAYEFKNSGYDVLNPSKTIKTYHVHATNVRDYKPSKTPPIPGPYYTLAPTELII